MARRGGRASGGVSPVATRGGGGRGHGHRRRFVLILVLVLVVGPGVAVRAVPLVLIPLRLVGLLRLQVTRVLAVGAAQVAPRLGSEQGRPDVLARVEVVLVVG